MSCKEGGVIPVTRCDNLVRDDILLISIRNSFFSESPFR